MLKFFIINSINQQFNRAILTTLYCRLLIMLIYIFFLVLPLLLFLFISTSCVADNSLGRTKKYIEVSGRPGPAEFLSPTYSGHLDRYNLTFKIESIPVLEEIKLLYRKLMVIENHIHFSSFILPS